MVIAQLWCKDTFVAYKSQVESYARFDFIQTTVAWRIQTQRVIISLTETMTNPTTSTPADVPTSDMPGELDLAFIIDATASMGSYIHSAQQNMRKIIENIITSERCLLNTALILYRDHPPQDSTFVTRVQDFTDDAEEAKKHIDGASASGGGDGPEAVTPALYAAVHTLSWRKNAVKIALLIADAPPHGLEPSGDGWPDGDPSGHDPMECVASLAERSVTLYTIGCEPAVTPYRDFFMALAFKTGGQYVPLANCTDLASIIVGSAKEEISLERLLNQVHEEVMREAALRGGPVDETELTRRIHEVMLSGGAKARRVKIGNQGESGNIPPITPLAEELSTLATLKEVREKLATTKGTNKTATSVPVFGALFGAAATPPVIPAKKTRTRTSKPAAKKTAVKRKAPSKVTPTIAKKPRREIPRGHRRSTRLALTNTNDEEETTEDEERETTPAAKPTTVPVAPKPTRMKIAVSHIDLKEDELLDISQTRRLVRKCVARNKLKST